MNKMSSVELRALFEELPRKKMVFTSTRLHKLENLSQDHKVNIFMKREDMGGPSTFGGNKMRKLELIMGQAISNKVDYIITFGAYQSNSAMQVTTACNIAGIKPILFLGDTKAQGIPDQPTGNLLLDHILGAEINYVSKPEPQDSLDLIPLWIKVKNECFKKVEELKAQGYNALFVEAGATHPDAWPSDVQLFAELLEQSKEQNFEIDYIFHTNGSCGSLPGMIAAKLLTGSNIKLMQMNVRSYKEGNLITKETALERTKGVFDRFNLPCPSDEEIYAQMNVDESYMGPGYGIPNEAAQSAIKEVARREGLMIDPTYTGKGFSGLLDYIKKGIVPEGSNVVFIHTGGTISLFSDPKLVEGLY